MKRGRAPVWVHGFWICLFVSWSLSISGILPIPARSRGVRQALAIHRRQCLLEHEQSELAAKITLRKIQAEGLAKDRSYQVREIRRTLGYVRPDEVVFHF